MGLLLRESFILEFSVLVRCFLSGAGEEWPLEVEIYEIVLFISILDRSQKEL